MKLSILTATYNRANLLIRLYTSILNNLDAGIDVEWLIMDDGSTDDTETFVNKIRKECVFDVKYLKQVNSGKMQAINNLMNYATGDLIIECDSDDCFTQDAFFRIKNAYEDSKYEEDIYAMCFLKYNQNGQNIGKEFSKEKTTMFDLYFKQLEDGEKALVFFTNIRKQYKYNVEKNEKFVTEASMYHDMDLNYKIKCYNIPILMCEYKEDGYSKNINKIFKKNSYGYLKYFKDILTKHDMVGVPISKRLYVIKHYILFLTLTKQKSNILENIDGLLNKILIVLLYIPGVIMTNIKFKMDKKK